MSTQPYHLRIAFELAIASCTLLAFCVFVPLNWLSPSCTPLVFELAVASCTPLAFELAVASCTLLAFCVFVPFVAHRLSRLP